MKGANGRHLLCQAQHKQHTVADIWSTMGRNLQKLHLPWSCFQQKRHMRIQRIRCSWPLEVHLLPFTCHLKNLAPVSVIAPTVGIPPSQHQIWQPAYGAPNVHVTAACAGLHPLASTSYKANHTDTHTHTHNSLLFIATEMWYCDRNFQQP